MNNSNLPTAGAPQKKTFSMTIAAPGMQAAIMNTLQDVARTKKFTSAIISAVTTNKQLQGCNAQSIISAALLGESLNLSPSPQLGQYYLMPFDLTVKGPDNKPLKDEAGNIVKEKHAEFVLGYKGYIQLAIRSAQYRDIGIMEIREGEYRGRDKMTGSPMFEFVEDDEIRNSLSVVGYMAYFELLNGFKKVMYWSKEKMLKYADTYAPAFSADSYEKLQKGEIPEKDKWKYSSFWYKSFDDMALKTMIRQLIKKWGIMSIEMQNAMDKDNSVIEVKGKEIVKADTGEEPVLETITDRPAEIVEKVDLDEL